MVWEQINFTSYGELKNFPSRAIFRSLPLLQKVHQSRKKITCEPDSSVVSFLALTKTTVSESMRTLSYFRLDTLHLVTYQLNLSEKQSQFGMITLPQGSTKRGSSHSTFVCEGGINLQPRSGTTAVHCHLLLTVCSVHPQN